MIKIGIGGEKVKNCLILLTSEYPFASEETFLESEINFHGENFEKIIILSIDLEKGAKKTREIPENADCYNVTPVDKKLGRLSDMFVGAVHSVIPSEYYSADREYINGDIKKRVFLEYFCRRAEREFRYCSDILDKYDFSEYDGIVIYSYWMFVPALIGVKIKDKLSTLNKNVRFVSRAHGYDLYRERNPLHYLPLRKYIMSKSDMVFTCSDDGRNYLIETYPEFENRIQTSHLGTFDHGVSGTANKNETVNIVSCSHFAQVKRLDRMVEGLALVKDIDVKWTHIGEGETRQSIETLAKEKLGHVNYHFVGRIPNSEVYNLYKNGKFDLFLNTSESEGIPVSVMEALSFGIPVIATNVGGVGEIITDGYNGKLLDSDFRPDALAEEIVNFSKLEKDGIEKIRQNSRELWNTKYNAEKNYSGFSSQLVHLLKIHS